LFGKNPVDLDFYVYQGAVGTWFAWQNTLPERPARGTAHGLAKPAADVE
jgi:hypothetical protein